MYLILACNNVLFGIGHLTMYHLLPTPEDDMVFRTNICILMSRILYQNMEYFKHSFDPVIDWHIKHEFYDEMSTKSTVVSSHSIRGGAAFVRIVR